jgi:hypothetical protein
MKPGHSTLGALGLSALAVVAVLGACGGTEAPANTEVIEWNRFASDLVAAHGSPAVQVHAMAIVQIAVHDALNAIEPRYAAYMHAPSAMNTTTATGATDASIATAVGAATRDTLVGLLPSATAAIDAHYAARLQAIEGGSANNGDVGAGIAAGRAAAAAILARRAGDDIAAASFFPHVPKAPASGVYQPTTPPDAPFVFGAGLGRLETFAIGDVAGFVSPAPLTTGSSDYAAEYDEVKSLGSAAGSTRTEQQGETARFWYDAATKEWHDAARQGLKAQGSDAFQAARVLALLGIAMFDSTVASFDAKFRDDYWRPITAVRAGDADGNDATVGDPSWQPLCITPPFPEHNSTHAATGAAAAGVLSRTLGDRRSFTITSPTLPGVTRTYSRYTEAAAEEGLSRIYCGIHFRHAMNAGLQQGDAVAARVLQTVLVVAARREAEFDATLQDPSDRGSDTAPLLHRLQAPKEVQDMTDRHHPSPRAGLMASTAAQATNARCDIPGTLPCSRTD